MLIVVEHVKTGTGGRQQHGIARLRLGLRNVVEPELKLRPTVVLRPTARREGARREPKNGDVPPTK